MKFEHVLQIYWSKGLLINGKLRSFDTPLKALFTSSRGFNQATLNNLIMRFEFYPKSSILHKLVSEAHPTLATSLNLIFSQLTSVNNSVAEVQKYQLLRLYLIKTTRGRSHALGKPSRGQRTWSNAWSAYHTNKITRAFIGAYQRTANANKKEEKINYKLLKKKSLRKQRKATVTSLKVQVNNWF